MTSYMYHWVSNWFFTSRLVQRNWPEINSRIGMGLRVDWLLNLHCGFRKKGVDSSLDWFDFLCSTTSVSSEYSLWGSSRTIWTRSRVNHWTTTVKSGLVFVDLPSGFWRLCFVCSSRRASTHFTYHIGNFRMFDQVTEMLVWDCL